MWMNFVSLTQMRGKWLYNCKESSNGFIFFPFLCNRLIICIANLCDWNWVEGCVCNFQGAIYYYKCKWKWAKLNFTGWLSTQSYVLLILSLVSFYSVFLPVFFFQCRRWRNLQPVCCGQRRSLYRERCDTTGQADPERGGLSASE